MSLITVQTQTLDGTDWDIVTISTKAREIVLQNRSAAATQIADDATEGAAGNYFTLPSGEQRSIARCKNMKGHTIALNGTASDVVEIMEISGEA